VGPESTEPAPQPHVATAMKDPALLALTKREYLVGEAASRPSVIESRFAAERRC
jgi:hypothetical protein